MGSLILKFAEEYLMKYEIVENQEDEVDWAAEDNRPESPAAVIFEGRKSGSRSSSSKRTSKKSEAIPMQENFPDNTTIPTLVQKETSSKKKSKKAKSAKYQDPFFF